MSPKEIALLLMIGANFGKVKYTESIKDTASGLKRRGYAFVDKGKLYPTMEGERLGRIIFKLSEKA